MGLALRRAGPAILASGVTNICALLVLALAEVNGTAGLGPVAAMGVAVAMVAMLTALPALLTIGGRRAFWPFVPQFQEGVTEVPEERGRWRRLGDRISASPRPIWIGTLAALLVLALGTLAFDKGITQQEDFRDDVESVAGQELLAASFPAGSAAPTDVIVPDRGARGRGDAGAAGAAGGVVGAAAGAGRARRPPGRDARPGPLLERGDRPGAAPAGRGEGRRRGRDAGRRAERDHLRPEPGGAATTSSSCRRSCCW